MRNILLCVAVLSCFFSDGQTDSLAIKDSVIVIIEATRALDKSPVTYSNMDKKEIERLNYGQDIPQLLRFTPSLVATSDAGNGIGYTGMWIRGSDPSRINVTINDIPLNDPESQQVFWVDVPDLATSTDHIQVQRGAGGSTFGSGSFGGAIKINTGVLSQIPYAGATLSGGSFNTFMRNVEFGTGKIAEHFFVEGRLSGLNSDGYIDRASSDLSSHFFTGTYLNGKTQLTAHLFGGHERTYQSWYGTPQSVIDEDSAAMQLHAINNGFTAEQTNNLLSSGRTYNYYTYDNQVDDYTQRHYQLHLQQFLSEKIRLNWSAHYTRGFGYYEEFRISDPLTDYGLENVEESQVVRRRHLENDFYGTVASLRIKGKNNETTFGGGFHRYDGVHFGTLEWLEYGFGVDPGAKYYQGDAQKDDLHFFARTIFTIQKFDIYADLQIRNMQYSTSGTDNNLSIYDVNDQYTFVNPRAGITYRINDHHKIFYSAAMAGHEPNRNDYVDAPAGTKPKVEQMFDSELGYVLQQKNWNAGLVLYNMSYSDQLVLTGALNDVGAPLRNNVKESYRRGIEFEFGIRPVKFVSWKGNVTFSENRIKEFTEVVYDYTNGFEIEETVHHDTHISFSPSLIAASQLEFILVDKKQRITLAGLTKYVGKQFLDNTSNDNRTIDPYLVNDVMLSIDFKNKIAEKFNLGIVINNVLDEHYESNGYTYSYIFGSRITENFYYPQSGRNFLVRLSVRI